MAQFRKDINALDQTTKTRYEVMMLDDGVTASGALVDAFGRLRISQPFTLFDSVNRYEKNDKFSELTANNGSVTYNAFESAVNLVVTNVSGDSVIRESKRVFTYQPGKSLLVMNTFAMAEANTNLTQRVGYFGANNGIFLESSNNEVYLVLRSQSTGSVVDTKIPQSEWNVDKFDGTDDEYSTGTTAFASGLDITKANILWIEIEWLGVGDVTCGFVGGGKLIPAHTFKHPNQNSTTYMTTGTLPIRYEISTSGVVTAVTSTLKQICSTVISEGGYEAGAPAFSAGRELNDLRDLTNVGTYYPVVSIRLAPNRLDSVIVPVNADLIGITNNASYRYKLILNGTIPDGSWITHSSNNVQYNISANSISGGTILNSGYLSTGVKGGTLDIGSRNEFSLQLGRTVGGTSDTLTLAVSTNVAGADVAGLFEWIELK
jgi:hypothetical protein